MAYTVEIPSDGSETKAYAVALTGATGTPAVAGYTITHIGGGVGTITIAEALVGRFVVWNGGTSANPTFAIIKEFKAAKTSYLLTDPNEITDTLLRIAAAAAAGTAAVTDNGNGTYTISFKDTDGTTEVANTTFTFATGARTRNS